MMTKTPDDLLRELEASGVLSGGPGAVTAKRRAVRRKAPTGQRRPALVLMVVAVLLAIVGATPIGQVALYPVSLFVTLIHEVCHALAAVLSGGTVVDLRVSRDLSGLTITQGGLVPAIASAGYVGASIIGALVIALPGRLARATFVGLALAPAVTLVFFHPANVFTWVTCAAGLAALLLLAIFLPRSWAAPLQLFLGLEIGLNALRDVATALLLTGTGAHVQTDADLMSSALFLRPVVWAAIWAGLSVLVLAAAVFRVAARFYSP